MRLAALALAISIALAPSAHAQQLTEADRRAVIDGAARVIADRYVYPDKARTIAAKLRRSAGLWRDQSDPQAFAKAVTEWLRKTGSDGHLGISYSAVALPEDGGDQTLDAAEAVRWYGPQLNHGVEKIERLPGNIMLLDLRVFPPVDMAGDVIAAAMTVVAQGDALIIDLRRNGGGGETANLVTGYLLDKPGEPLSGFYNRPQDRQTYGTSPSWVPGRRFGGTKPLYILTSKRTFSAAEALAYDLQALKRATIVGEVTGGGAHPFEYRRVHPHFAVDLPEALSINPITGANWQDVGVKPDVAVPADRALDAALELARAAIAKAAPAGPAAATP